MVEPVILKFPIPTPEETADYLGVPRSRIKWLRSILVEQGSLPAERRKSASKKTSAKPTKVGSQGRAAKSKNAKVSA